MHTSYRENPISAVVMLILSYAAMGIAMPLLFQTLFNVTRGLTLKEKVNLDKEASNRYNYEISCTQ